MAKRTAKRRRQALPETHQPPPPPQSHHNAEEDRVMAAEAPTPAAVSLLDLPFVLILSLFDFIASIPDLFSFAAAICRPIRSLLAPWFTPTSLPPLLLNPHIAVNPPRPQTPGRNLVRPSQVRWLDPPFCTIHTLEGPNARSYLCPVSPEALIQYCIGYSHGQLVFITADRKRAFLADVFTGRVTASPAYPNYIHHQIYAVLTAPVASSPRSILVIVCLQGVAFWRLGTENWVSETRLSLMNNARSIAIFRERIYFLDYYHYGLTVVDVDPESNSVSITRLKVKPLITPFMYFGCFNQYLVVCGEELLLLLFGHPMYDEQQGVEPKIYRLDNSISKWTEVMNIGDWCIFLDAVGRCPIACPNPGRWGGKANAIYIAGPGPNHWAVHPLDGEEEIIGDTVLDHWYVLWREWPFPVWVYPSVLY